MTFIDAEDRQLVKDIVKLTQAKLQERVIPQATVLKWATKVENMASDIEKLVWVSCQICLSALHLNKIMCIHLRIALLAVFFGSLADCKRRQMKLLINSCLI